MISRCSVFAGARSSTRSPRLAFISALARGERQLMVAAVEVDLVGVPEIAEPFALQDSSQNIVLRLLEEAGTG